MSVIKRQTIINTTYSYIGVIIGTLTQAYFIPNYFTTSQNGLLQLLLSYMFILAQIGSLGFNNAGIRFFPYFRNSSNGHNGYLNLGLTFSFFGFLICTILLFLFKGWFVNSNSADVELFENYFYLLIPLGVATILFNLFDTFSRSMYKSISGTFYSQLLQRLFVLIVVLLFCVKLYDFNAFIWFWVAAICLPTILMIMSSQSVEGFSLKASTFFRTSIFRKEFLTFSSVSALTGLSSIIISQVDKIFVYKYLGLADTGIYATCLLFGSVMAMAYNASAKAASAIVMDAFRDNDIQKIDQIYKKSSITLYFSGIVLLVAVWINIDYLFSFIKAEYSAGKTVLILIGLSKLIDLANGINSLILAYSKHYKYDSILMVLFLFLLVGLNGLLIPKYGMNGAGLAALISVIIYNLSRTILVFRFYRIFPFGKEHIYLTIFGLLSLLLGFYLPNIDSSLPIMRLFSIVYKSFIVSFIFIALTYKVCISKEINELIDQVINKLRNKVIF